MLAWGFGSSLAYFPHSVSYFNELVGGPRNGFRHLLDSNIEWGQDLELVRRWALANPQARPLYVAAYYTIDPSNLGVPSSGFPPSGPHIDPDRYVRPDEKLLGPAPGWFAVGVAALMADSHPDRGNPVDPGVPYCGYFQHFQPVGRFGYSMYLYHLTPESANRMREKMGLAPLPPDFKPPNRYPFLMKRHAKPSAKP
jgi:hypothetical protein